MANSPYPIFLSLNLSLASFLGEEMLGHGPEALSSFGEPIRLHWPVLDLVAQELSRRSAGLALARESDLLGPPIGPRRFVHPLRPGPKEPDRIPARGFPGWR